MLVDENLKKTNERFHKQIIDEAKSFGMAMKGQSQQPSYLYGRPLGFQSMEYKPVMVPMVPVRPPQGYFAPQQMSMPMAGQGFELERAFGDGLSNNYANNNTNEDDFE